MEGIEGIVVGGMLVDLVVFIGRMGRGPVVFPRMGGMPVGLVVFTRIGGKLSKDGT